MEITCSDFIYGHNKNVNEKRSKLIEKENFSTCAENCFSVTWNYLQLQFANSRPVVRQSRDCLFFKKIQKSQTICRLSWYVFFKGSTSFQDFTVKTKPPAFHSLVFGFIFIKCFVKKHFQNCCLYLVKRITKS